MKVRNLTAIALAALMLAACGKVEEETQRPAVNVEEIQLTTGDEDVTTGEEETEKTNEEETTTEEETAKPQSESDIELSEYIDGFLADGFGFELYNHGHMDAWNARYAIGEVILKTLANDCSVDTAIDAGLDVYDLNAKETDGFMTWLKFEDEKEIRVGSEILKGNMVMIIDDGNNFYFAVDDGSYMTPLMDFPVNAIVEIMDTYYAYQEYEPEGQYPQTTEETETGDDISQLKQEYLDRDHSNVGLQVYCKGKNFDTFGGESSLDSTQADLIVTAMLEELAKPETAATMQNTNTIDYRKYTNDQNGFMAGFEFREATDVWVGDDLYTGVWYISASGSDEDGYKIQVDGGSVMDFSAEVYERIANIVYR